MAKKFRIRAEQIQSLTANRAACIASDRILVDGCRVGRMYREESDDTSGWIFLAGDETQEYVDEAGNFGIYSLNTVANYDRRILPLLDAPLGSEFVHDDATNRLVPLNS